MAKQQQIPGTGEAPPSALMQARILAEALPHMQRYDRQTVVVKYGGHAMGDPALAAAFAQDIVLLKQAGVNPIVVHGGGPQIAGMLKRLELKSEFVHGLRVTDKPTVEVVEMVLAGLINKDIVTAINRQGGKAVGISGKDANLMIARKITEMPDPESNLMQAVDIGYVGDPAEINPHIVEVISASDVIPVIAPVAISREGETLNINADTFASALAARMKAKRLLLLTDVAGVLDKDGELLQQLTIEEARKLIREGIITGGMIPKIEGCIEVVEAGVEAVVVIDGRVPHCVLLELFTEHGVGTLVSRKAKKGPRVPPLPAQSRPPHMRIPRGEREPRRCPRLGAASRRRACGSSTSTTRSIRPTATCLPRWTRRWASSSLATWACPSSTLGTCRKPTTASSAPPCAA
jgi:acetylglutamate kinase